jgi:hypothetical protein
LYRGGGPGGGDGGDAVLGRGLGLAEAVAVRAAAAAMRAAGGGGDVGVAADAGDGLLALADELRERGVGLVVLKQQIDTITSADRLVFHILGAIDEFQRELIIEAPARIWTPPGPAGAPAGASPS